MTKIASYFSLKNLSSRFNRWDIVALFLILSIIISLASAAREMSIPFHVGEALSISLDPRYLPSYAMQSVIRIGLALILSLTFTFVFATLAAKNRPLEKIIIPAIDTLQSVPVLAFLSITIVWFITLFPHSLWGPQFASVFLIFTAQAWNMALSFYQSLKTVPVEFKEAADMFHLSAWQRFWRIEVPFSMPSLLWNTMMSMSASWFALVASEGISVYGQKIPIPGIGSYIALAIEQANIQAVINAIIAMFIVIFLYDQILLRPLIQWSDKFNIQMVSSEKSSRSWMLLLLQRTLAMNYIRKLFEVFSDKFINIPIFRSRLKPHEHALPPTTARSLIILWNGLLILFIGYSIHHLGTFISRHVTLAETKHVVFLGLCTGLRVLAVIIASTLIWVPIGVWVGLRPKVAEIIQPIAQFLAAFPANLLFPIVVIIILKWNLNVEIWTTPLMMLGAQWYVLFNVTAGATAIPKDLQQVADNFGLKGWMWWRRLILPGIFPYYVTGAITAVGGAWNASLVAEVVIWGKTTLTATGIGSYIMQSTGNFPHTALGVCVMCLLVLFFNRLVWRPLYIIAQSRFTLS